MLWLITSLFLGGEPVEAIHEIDVSVERGGRQILIKYNKSEFEPRGRYRWINTVTDDPKGAPNVRRGSKPVVPYTDPPAGGWSYDVADDSPYYWDDADCKECRARHRIDHHKVWSNNTFVFEDMPSDHRLEGNESLKFTTCLVDTYRNNKELVCQDWQLNSNGEITYTK